LGIPEIIILASMIIGTWIFYPLIFGAIWQPTPMEKVSRMLEMAEVGSKDVLYDLGSGDGRMITTAAREFGARAVGIEVDPILVSWSRIRIRISGLSGRARIIRGNLFKSDISEATVVTLFLRQGVNNALREKLKRELKPGTRVVSYVHTFEGWKPVKADEKLEIYLYVV